MDRQSPRFRLPKDRPVREVPQLFPETKIELSPEEGAYYRALRPFAFAIDRQSLPKKAKEDNATGMIRRVEAILFEARHRDLWVPQPFLKPEPRPKGELPYDFPGECAFHWFVDGTDKKATGFAANQNARPQLWRSFLLAQALAEMGCAPRAFLVGEGTRLFRDEGWLTHFCRALWRYQIAVYVGGFGAVDRNTLPGFVAYINAVSGWLGTVNKAARKIRREQGRIFHGQPPVPLGFDKSRTPTLVYAHPEQWPLVGEMLVGLNDGSIRSTAAASQWLCERGLRKCQTWVTDLIHSPILDGYYVCGDKTYTPRQLVQKGGLFFDLDIAPGGTRRYLVTPSEQAERYPIEHPYGTQPFSPALVRSVRAKIRGQGRRKQHDLPSDCLIPSRLLRCSRCGHAVQEQCPNGRAHPKPIWRLTCRCVQALTQRPGMTRERAQQMPEAQHVRTRRGRISEAVWVTLYEALIAHPVEPDEPDTNTTARRAELEGAVARATAAFEAFQDRAAAGELGDQKNPLVRASVEKRRAALLADWNAAQRELELFAADALVDQRLNASLREAQAALRFLANRVITVEDQREIIVQLVDKVVVNLETGDFVIHVHTSIPQLRELAGKMGQKIRGSSVAD